MQEDALRWNERYQHNFMPFEPSAFMEIASSYIKQYVLSKSPMIDTSFTPLQDSYTSQSLHTHPTQMIQDSYNTRYLHHKSFERPLGLDVACGNGRNAKFLAQLGLSVDAIDISSVALEHLQDSPHITPILADLDTFCLASQYYDVILNSYFLDRRLFPALINALKPHALLLFETFIDIHSQSIKNERILHSGELEQYFSVERGFHILYHHIYENKDSHKKVAYPHIVRFIAQYLPKHTQ